MSDAKQGLLSAGELAEIRESLDRSHWPFSAQHRLRQLLDHIAALEADTVRLFLAHPHRSRAIVSRDDSDPASPYAAHHAEPGGIMGRGDTPELACAAALRALEEGGRDGE